MSRSTFRNVTRWANPSGMVMDAAGISSSNTARQLLNPGGVAMNNIGDAYQEGGARGVLGALQGGDLTDPGGLFHRRGNPAQVPAPPDMGQANTQSARDRVRRAVYRAQGRSSTIRSAYGASNPFNGQPKALLGS